MGTDSKVLPEIALPCPHFPCTEKSRPQPLTHRWAPLMSREPVVNHFRESRNMTLDDLRAVLEALGPEDRAAIGVDLINGTDTVLVAVWYYNNLVAAESRAAAAEEECGRLQMLCASAMAHLHRIGAVSGSVADRAQTAAEIHEGEVTRLRDRNRKLEDVAEKLWAAGEKLFCGTAMDMRRTHPDAAPFVKASREVRAALDPPQPQQYHPDPEINAGCILDAIEAERADLAAGYPPRRWICPCGASHSRGHFPAGQIGSHRCLRCGYVGTEGVMVDDGRADPPQPRPAEEPGEGRGADCEWLYREIIKAAREAAKAMAGPPRYAFTTFADELDRAAKDTP